MVNNRQFQAKNSGLSLVEVLVSMLILAVVIGGLTNLFLSTKELVLHLHSRMVAGKLGRYFLDPLQMYVRQDTWGVEPDADDEDIGNLLTEPTSVTTGYKTADNLFATYPDADYKPLNWMSGEELDGNIYYPVYAVSKAGELRKLKLTICWQE